MSKDWNEFLKASGANLNGDGSQVENFGNASAELQAAANGTVIASLGHLSILECSGEDTKEFLHNQLTSDINHLQAGQAQHAAWCSAKGRMLVSFLAWRQEENYRLALSSDLMSFIQKRLQMYVLRSKVKISNLLESQVIIGLSGPEAATALTQTGLAIPAETLTSTDTGTTQVIRLDDARYLIITPIQEVQTLWQKLNQAATPVGVSTWQWLDIRAGLPLVTEATKEEFVPQMADFEKIGGVSFHKGCYPGQEVVARTQYLGKVKRHLYRVTSAAPLQAGDHLHSPEHPDQATGQIVIAAPSPTGGFAALAVVQANFAENLHLKAIDGLKVEAVAINP